MAVGQRGEEVKDSSRTTESGGKGKSGGEGVKLSEMKNTVADSMSGHIWASLDDSVGLV